jgi:hypothetical protein
MNSVSLQIKGLLDGHLGFGSTHKNDEVSYSCPFCHHYKKKLQVNLISYRWHCWVCNSKGSTLNSLLKKSQASESILSKVRELTGTSTTKQYRPTTDTKHITLPEEYIPLWKGNTQSPFFKNALHYITNTRKLTKYDILKYQIGYCESGDYGGMIIVPSYDCNGMLNYFVGRSFYNSATIRHKNPEISKDVVGFDNIIDWTQPITLVEGVFDAIATKRNTIPLFGKKILPQLRTKIIENRVQIINIALDPDAIVDAVEEIEYFLSLGIQVRRVDLKQDPSDTGYECMTQLISNTQNITLYDLITLKMAI